jgi:hypothetical protein
MLEGRVLAPRDTTGQSDNDQSGLIAHAAAKVSDEPA